MKKLAILCLLAAPGCQGFSQALKDDPMARQIMEEAATAAAQKAALRVASEFQITDESAVKRLVDESKKAADVATAAAVTRLETQDRAARAQWREETKAQISASLKGIGGALSATGNPILLGLGLLMGIGGALTSPRKKEGQPA